MEGEGFYRRPLPDTCVDFASEEGRTVFAEAMLAGHMRAYFPLAAQFHTQSEPAYCGLGTLVMVLNALAIDPQRIWKGPWRWFSEELLDCCSPLEVVKSKGITIPQFVCLAKCNGAIAKPIYALESDINTFRALVKEYSTKDDGFIAVSYDRRRLKQTGSGHFSPIGGYHAEKDLVLILDVARFKYSPHWVPLAMLFDAMQTIDSATTRSRGYICLSTEPKRQHLFSRLKLSPSKWKGFVDQLSVKLSALLLQDAVENASAGVEVEQFVESAMTYMTTTPQQDATSNNLISDFFSTYEQDMSIHITDEHRRMIEELFAEIRSTLIHGVLLVVGSRLPASSSRAVMSPELATIVLLFLLRLLREEGAIRFGKTLEEATGQLEGLPRLRDEVDNLWASFLNISRFCACRDRRPGAACPPTHE